MELDVATWKVRFNCAMSNTLDDYLSSARLKCLISQNPSFQPVTIHRTYGLRERKDGIRTWPSFS